MTSELTKVELVPNLNGERSGLKAYGYLLNKYGFNPTKPGPFTTVSLLAKPEKLGPHPLVVDGRPAKQQQKLQYKDEHGRVGKVPAESIQNDLEWLCPVKVGTPPRTYNLIFDSGSADTWVCSVHPILESKADYFTSFGLHNCRPPQTYLDATSSIQLNPALSSPPLAQLGRLLITMARLLTVPSAQILSTLEG